MPGDSREPSAREIPSGLVDGGHGWGRSSLITQRVEVRKRGRWLKRGTVAWDGGNGWVDEVGFSRIYSDRGLERKQDCGLGAAGEGEGPLSHQGYWVPLVERDEL